MRRLALLLSLIFCLDARAEADGSVQISAEAAGNAELEALLAKYAEAASQFYDGKPDAVKALWSHRDDVTLSGAAGGETAKGWKQVSARLEWASAQFSRGSKTVEPIQMTVSGEFAYVVQYERILYYPLRQPTQTRRDYRVTTVFRREPVGWRVVHRHADTMLKRQAIK
jgi:ketosteroid isomerase-like protein